MRLSVSSGFTAGDGAPGITVCCPGAGAGKSAPRTPGCSPAPPGTPPSKMVWGPLSLSLTPKVAVREAESSRRLHDSTNFPGAALSPSSVRLGFCNGQIDDGGLRKSQHPGHSEGADRRKDFDRAELVYEAAEALIGARRGLHCGKGAEVIDRTCIRRLTGVRCCPFWAPPRESQAVFPEDTFRPTRRYPRW